MRQNLERNWQSHHFDKIKRESEEKERLRTPGMLLLQQTDKYRWVALKYVKNIALYLH